ncbi:hypothetical protein GCM10023220_30090 [Streptomyces ziwulingensis]|uniref:Uncharacterized protein n=1 Tax=Streptomyces ziwulingensis TaxID=1045501 RepID=A0ABP9BWX8_9ACTN
MPQLSGLGRGAWPTVDLRADAEVPAGLRTRVRPDEAPSREVCAGAVSGVVCPSGFSAPPVPLTAARQFRIHTGFPDHGCGTTGLRSVPTSRSVASGGPVSPR